MNAPCPICAAPYGFHDDAPHAAAAQAIPAQLKRRSNTEVRRATRLAWAGRSPEPAWRA